MHFFHNKYVVDHNNEVLGLTPKDAPAVTRKPLYVLLGLLVFSFVCIGLIYVEANVFSYLFYLLLGSITLIALLIFTDKTLSTLEKKKVSVIFVVSFFVIFFGVHLNKRVPHLLFLQKNKPTDHWVPM
jgi:POT family proton-dependent oligopeptide transporter